jgi:hypothetical protein
VHTAQYLPPISVTTVAIINVLDVNERPVLSPSRVLLDENSPVGTLVGFPIIVRDQDVDRPGSAQLIGFSLGPLSNGSSPPFAIDPSSGQIQVSANVLNFEAVPLYNLTVIATDDGVPSLSATTTVTVVLRCVSGRFLTVLFPDPCMPLLTFAYLCTVVPVPPPNDCSQGFERGANNQRDTVSIRHGERATGNNPGVPWRCGPRCQRSPDLCGNVSSRCFGFVYRGQQ